MYGTQTRECKISQNGFLLYTLLGTNVESEPKKVTNTLPPTPPPVSRPCSES